jgi:hypothetical protein
LRYPDPNVLKSEGPYETVATIGWSMLSCLMNCGSAARYPRGILSTFIPPAGLLAFLKIGSRARRGTNGNDAGNPAVEARNDAVKLSSERFFESFLTPVRYVHYATRLQIVVARGVLF